MNKLELGRVSITAQLPTFDRVVWITPSTYQGRTEVVVYENTVEYLRDHPDAADLQSVQYLLDRNIAVGFLPIRTVTTKTGTFSGNDLLSKLVLGDITIYSKSSSVPGLKFYFSKDNKKNLLTISNKRYTEKFYITKVGEELGEIDGIKQIPVNLINQESQMISVAATTGDLDEDKWNSFIGKSGTLVPPTYLKDNYLICNPNLYRNPDFYTAFTVASSVRDIDLEDLPVDWHPDFIVINAPAGGSLTDDYQEGNFIANLDELAAATRSQVITIENKEDLVKDVVFLDHFYWYWDNIEYSWAQLESEIRGWNWELLADWLRDREDFDPQVADRIARSFGEKNSLVDMKDVWTTKEEASTAINKAVADFELDFRFSLGTSWKFKNIPEQEGDKRVYHYEYSLLRRQISATDWYDAEYLQDNSFSVANDYVYIQGANLPVWALYINIIYQGKLVSRLSDKYKFTSLTREELMDVLTEDTPYCHNMNTVSRDELGLILDMPMMQNTSRSYETFIQNFILGSIHRVMKRYEITRENLVKILDLALGIVDVMEWTDSCSYSYEIVENTVNVKFSTTIKYLINKTITVNSDITLIIK